MIVLSISPELLSIVNSLLTILVQSVEFDVKD